MSKQRCAIPGCSVAAKWPSLALCGRHCESHMDECRRRGVMPFKPPKRTYNAEMRFNKVDWFWFRGAWRPSAA
jgi:hypothetical protein